jgi:phage terminase large subunit GpA-like protein
MRVSDLQGDALDFSRSIAAAFAPPPDQMPSAWAEANLVLTSDFASEPGQYNLDRTPWCRAPLDDAADATVDTVIVTGASQCGKTQLSLAVVAYYAGVQPCPIMHVVPTDGLAGTFAARFDSMIAASPALRDKFVRPRRTRAVANKSVKTFEGGVLILASAASPTDLSSRPVKLAIADEIDRMGVLRKEGDPLLLIQARQQTFYARKFYGISTPTVMGHSRVEHSYEQSTRFEWEAACPCGGHHVLDWQHVSWEVGQPEAAVYVMPCCGVVLTDAERWRAAQAGRWAKIGDGKPGWRGYRFNGLCSPWVRLAELAIQFEAAKGQPSKLQPFWNLKLGLPFDGEIGEGADADVVRAAAETWKPNTIPTPQIVLLTAGIDVQQTWLAVHIVGWSDADEAWTLGWHEIPGDPLDPRTWAALDDLLLGQWRHPSGEMLGIEAAGCDSGFLPQGVYEWSARNRVRGRRWYAVKGMAGAGRPIWLRGGDVAASLSKLFIIGLDAAKGQIASGLIAGHDSPGRWHTPVHIHEQAPHFADWFCAEELVTKEIPGGTRQEWRKRKGSARNEVWDTAVYALAARYSSDFRIPQRLENLAAYGLMKPKPTNTIADLATRMAALNAPAGA